MQSSEHSHKLLRVIGNRIRSARMNMGLSQEQLAEIAGFHRTYIGMIERGEINITFCSSYALAGALNISLSELFYDIENEETEHLSVCSSSLHT